MSTGPFEKRRRPPASYFEMQAGVKLFLSLPLAEKMLDVFDFAIQKGMTLPPELYALYKQMETQVGEPE